MKILNKLHIICSHLIPALILFPALLSAQNLPGVVRQYISSIKISEIGNTKAALDLMQVEPGLFKARVKWQLTKDVKQHDVSVTIQPAFKPGFHWAPHLTPTPQHIIAQHVFRSPALIVSNNTYSINLIPDLDQFKAINYPPMYMDMDAEANRFSIGFSKSRVDNHVLFMKDTGMVLQKGMLELAFYLKLEKQDTLKQSNPFRWVNDFLWKNWGRSLWQQGEPLNNNNLGAYVEATYNWAFNLWKKPLWQEFTLNNKRVGAPVFIVNITQSPNFKGEINERETRSIWNQAWFSSLRSASGLYRYARRTNNVAYKKYALMTKELALAFPQTNGFFPAVVLTDMYDTSINGKIYNRSRGWSSITFGNSNRNPVTGKLEESPYHILDMSFTALQMLNWYADLEKDKRLLNYAIQYADALLRIQQADGFFPAWLSAKTLMPLPYLNQSPETSLSVTFLLKLYEITKAKRYLNSATKALRAVDKEILPTGKWEDFETYWSCSRFGSDTLIGKKVMRNNQFKQNTLSIFYTAQAFLEIYKITKQQHYLMQGQRVLDELLMFQASWQPPFIAVRSIGGFGVMNADAEWNDSRQSLFAPIILEYGIILNKAEYMERGKAALHASFTMMYHPLNEKTMQQWQAKYPFFNNADYGFMMENYGHDGVTNNAGLGIGEFTIYDWGNGSAAEAFNYILDKGLTQ